MGTTVRRIDSAKGGNRIITRTFATLLLGMVPSQEGVKRARHIMQGKFDARFPALKGLKMQYAWAGHPCLSRNGVSVAREIDEGLYSACVQNGFGTARGILTGIAAAEAAIGCKSEIRDCFESQGSPSHLPPRPFMDLGANALLKFREWRARFE